MLKIQRSSNGEVIFTLIGQIQSEHLAELQRLFSLENGSSRIALDLKEVTLVDRKAVKFLSQCESDSIGIKNCPPYIREWIEREKKQSQTEP